MKRTRVLGAILATTAALLSVGAPAASARLRSTSPAPTISATASPTLLVVNQSSAVSGKVTPARTTPTVFLQRKVGGVWLDRGSAKVDRTTGAYRIAMRPSQTGAYSLRVRSAGGGVISRTISIRIWSSKQVYSGKGNYTSGRIPFAGGTYNIVSHYTTSGCTYHGELVGTPGDIRSTFPIGMMQGGLPAIKMDQGIPRGNYTLKMATGASCAWTITFWRY